MRPSNCRKSSRASDILLLTILVASSCCCSSAQTPSSPAAKARPQLHPRKQKHSTYLLPPRGVPADAIRPQGGNLVSATTGQPVRVRAAVWTGHTSGGTFDDFLAATPGDDQEGARLTAALVAGTSALLEQGFNSVQLPLALGAALAAQPAAAAARCRQVPVSEFKLNATISHSSTHGPQQLRQQPQCTSLLPNTTALDRVLWSIQWFAAHGLLVSLSGSSATSSSAISTNSSKPAGCGSGAASANATSVGSCAAGDLPHDAAGRDEAKHFAAAWASMWRAVAGLPNFEADLQGRVLLQLLQDPAAAGARWEAGAANSAGSASGLGALYLAAMDAVEAVRPGAALFILPGAAQRSEREGGGQIDSSSSSNAVWGHGYATEPAMMAAGMSDPRPFLTALVGKPYSGRVVLAPYALGQPPPPSALPSPALPVDAAKVLDNSFSKLSTVGFCTGAHPHEHHMSAPLLHADAASERPCARFPVCLPAGRAQLFEQQPGIEDELAAFAAQLQEDVLMQQQAGTDLGHSTTTAEPPGNWVFWDFADGGGVATQDKHPAPAAAAAAAAPGQTPAPAAAGSGHAEEGAPRRMQAEPAMGDAAAASELSASRMRAADKVFAHGSGAGSTRLIISDDAQAAASEGDGV